MAYIPPNVNGSATSANSSPVVIASDQVAIAVKNSTATNLKVDPSGVTSPVSIATAPVLVTGSAVIGKVGIDQTTPGTTNLVALAANQTVNETQINGVTPLMGNGTTGTGSQRVTIASDNTAFSVNSNQGTAATVGSG